MKIKKPDLPVIQAPTLWPKGLTPLPFQLEGLRFVLARLSKHRAAYLAADPGLGKTISACLLTSAFRQSKPTPLKVCYICPPSLPANVQAEFKKWGHKNNMPVIISESDLQRRHLDDDGVWVSDIAPIKADLVFVDEVHRYKNEKALRTAGLFQILRKAKKIVFLSGTPLPNSRPVELWSIVSRYAPDVFGREFFPYGKAFCGARKVDIGGGRMRWKFDGFTNRALYRRRLFKSFMCRQKKELLDLPEKREGILTLGDDIPPIIGKLEKTVLDAFTKSDLLEGKIISATGDMQLHFAKYMRLLGEEKLKHLYPFIEHLVYETKENVILFAHHKSVIEGLATFLAQMKPIVITGATPVKARHGMVQRFQNGKTRFAIMNLTAGGIGWNMTNADRVLLIEPSWRDGDNVQGGDRAHRIGRKKPVLVQYVVLKDSFDAKRMSVILRKRQGAV